MLRNLHTLPEHIKSNNQNLTVLFLAAQAEVNLAEKEGKLSVALSLYSAVFQGNVCVAAALIKGISKDYIPRKLERHYQY